MKKIRKIIKRNIKLVIAFIIGSLVAASIGTYASIVIQGTAVDYSNTSSGLSATKVQAAIDELTQRTSIRGTSNFVEAYTYNASTCVTGEESTCVATTCYKTKSANSCGAGTIIKYRVRPSEVVTFHVMYDDASTITMQAQKNTVYNRVWYETRINTSGPLDILGDIESTTAGWSNVNDITYTAGTTKWGSMPNAYTGCSAYNSCTTNTYTMSSRTAKARLITLQETNLLGCTSSNKSCPKWMNNYLRGSRDWGSTVNDTLHSQNADANEGYWMMSARTTLNQAWFVSDTGAVGPFDPRYSGLSARAVVVVSK